MVAWAIELSQYNIGYYPRTTIKGLVLADFIVECSFSTEPEEERRQSQNPRSQAWTLYVDGSSTKERCGFSIILSSFEGFEVKQALRFTFTQLTMKPSMKSCVPDSADTHPSSPPTVSLQGLPTRGQTVYQRVPGQRRDDGQISGRMLEGDLLIRLTHPASCEQKTESAGRHLVKVSHRPRYRP